MHNVLKASLLALPLLFGIASSAHADSFSFSVSDGRGWGGDHRAWNHGWGPHHGWRPHHYYERGYGAVVIEEPGYYEAPYYEERYVAAPPVVYQDVPPLPAAMHATQTSDTYTDDEGRYCREFQSTIKVGKKYEPAYGTACMQPDGSWQVVH